MAALEKHPDLRLQQNSPSGKGSLSFKAVLLGDPVSGSLRRRDPEKSYLPKAFY